jgi:hypothetical protein
MHEIEKNVVLISFGISEMTGWDLSRPDRGA